MEDDLRQQRFHGVYYPPKKHLQSEVSAVVAGLILGHIIVFYFLLLLLLNCPPILLENGLYQ